MVNAEQTIRTKFLALSLVMDERLTRLWTGAEADALGDGGIATVERATGLSRTTIRAGRDELRAGVTGEDAVAVRRPGGGRPRIEDTSPDILDALESLVDPVTRGDPESPLRWTSKSTRKLAEELAIQFRVHDFIDDGLGKVISYGVYDLAHNTGWVSVGIDRDTPAFAVASIARWWRQMGKRTYPDARELLITADAGGSNSARARLWKVELQRFATRTGLTISVSHFPPGTSTWNKIEHRLFCHITENWRGPPLVARETVVQLIGSVRTTTGLTVKAQLDTRAYPVGIKVPDAAMENVLITRADFHGDWNYTIHPRAANS